MKTLKPLLLIILTVSLLEIKLAYAQESSAPDNSDKTPTILTNNERWDLNYLPTRLFVPVIVNHDASEVTPTPPSLPTPTPFPTLTPPPSEDQQPTFSLPGPVSGSNFAQPALGLQGPEIGAQLIASEQAYRVVIVPSAILIQPGEKRWLGVWVEDAQGNRYAGDPSYLDLQTFGPEGYRAAWQEPGRILIQAPDQFVADSFLVSVRRKDLEPGRILLNSVSVIGMAQAKSEVSVVAEEKVGFPVSYDALDAETLRHRFGLFTREEWLRTIDVRIDFPEDRGTFPVLVSQEALTGLQPGQLIAGEGEAIFYGRLREVTAQRNGYALLTVEAALPWEVYDFYQTNIDIQSVLRAGMIPFDFGRIDYSATQVAISAGQENEVVIGSQAEKKLCNVQPPVFKEQDLTSGTPTFKFLLASYECKKLAGVFDFSAPLELTVTAGQFNFSENEGIVGTITTKLTASANLKLTITDAEKEKSASDEITIAEVPLPVGNPLISFYANAGLGTMQAQNTWNCYEYRVSQRCSLEKTRQVVGSSLEVFNWQNSVEASLNFNFGATPPLSFNGPQFSTKFSIPFLSAQRKLNDAQVVTTFKSDTISLGFGLHFGINSTLVRRLLEFLGSTEEKIGVGVELKAYPAKINHTLKINGEGYALKATDKPGPTTSISFSASMKPTGVLIETVFKKLKHAIPSYTWSFDPYLKNEAPPISLQELKLRPSSTLTSSFLRYEGTTPPTRFNWSLVDFIGEYTEVKAYHPDVQRDTLGNVTGEPASVATVSPSGSFVIEAERPACMRLPSDDPKRKLILIGKRRERALLLGSIEMFSSDYGWERITEIDLCQNTKPGLILGKQAWRDYLIARPGDTVLNTLVLHPKDGFDASVTFVLQDFSGQPAPDGILLSPNGATVNWPESTIVPFEIRVAGHVPTGVYALQLTIYRQVPGEPTPVMVNGARFTLAVGYDPQLEIEPTTFTITDSMMGGVRLTNRVDREISYRLLLSGNGPGLQIGSQTLQPGEALSRTITSGAIDQLDIRAICPRPLESTMQYTYDFSLLETGAFRDRPIRVNVICQALTPGVKLIYSSQSFELVAPAPGEPVTATLVLSPVNGYSGTVSLQLESVSGGDAPVGVSVSPSNAVLNSTTPLTQTLVFSIPETISAGTYPLRLVVNDGISGAHSISVQLIVRNSSIQRNFSNWQYLGDQFEEIASRWLGGVNATSLSYGFEKFVLATEVGLFVSSNGAAWDFLAYPSKRQIYRLVHFNDRFIGVGASGTVIISQNGLNWDLRVTGTNKDLYGIAYGNGRYVVVGDGVILTSSNLISWTRIETSAALSDIAFGNGLFVATGSDTLYSYDGINWLMYATNFPGWEPSVYGAPPRLVYGAGKFVITGASISDRMWVLDAQNLSMSTVMHPANEWGNRHRRVQDVLFTSDGYFVYVATEYNSECTDGNYVGVSTDAMTWQVIDVFISTRCLPLLSVAENTNGDLVVTSSESYYNAVYSLYNVSIEAYELRSR